MLDRQHTGLILIDVQGKLARIVHDSEGLLRSLRTLIQGCRTLELPILWLEQNPRGLGVTVPELSELLTDLEPMEKQTFSACHDEAFLKALAASGMRQWLVCGIETHICVYQTVAGLLDRRYEVEVVSDAISSRAPANIALALEKMQRLGARLTSVEMALYELVQDARAPEFKPLLALMK